MITDPNFVDPPKQYCLEMNWEKDCRLKNYQCDKCEAKATMECEINGPKLGNSTYGVYCKEHYETLFEDLLNELTESSNNWDEED